MTARFCKLLPLCLLALLLTAVLGCGGLTPPQTFDEPVNNPTLTQAGMKSAIEEAGMRRDWKMKDTAPGQMQGALTVRSHTIVVDIFYTANNFKITYRDSVNMDFDGTKIHPNYNVWVKELADGIKVLAVSQ